MRRTFILGLILIGLLESCRSLPKVTTFVDASSQLRKGVNTGFVAVQQSLLTDDLINDKEFTDDEKKLTALFRVIDKSLLGLTAYSAALNNLVESGNSGEKNASQVADALTKIVDQVASKPAGLVVGLTGEGAAKLYGQIAKIKAANDLKLIMDEAQPTVDSLRSVYSRITGELIKYNRAVYKSKRQLLITPETLNKTIIDYDTYLDKEQVSLFSELALISQYKAGVSKDAAMVELKKIDKLVTDEASIEIRQTALVLQSKRIDSEKIRIVPLIDRIHNAQKRYVNEFNMIDQLFKKSDDALSSWAATHADIRRQLDKKSLPSFQELIELVDDLKEIRGKIKSLNP